MIAFIRISCNCRNMSQERSQISHRPTGIVNTLLDINNLNMEGDFWSLELLDQMNATTTTTK